MNCHWLEEGSWTSSLWAFKLCSDLHVLNWKSILKLIYCISNPCKNQQTWKGLTSFRGYSISSILYSISFSFQPTTLNILLTWKRTLWFSRSIPIISKQIYIHIYTQAEIKAIFFNWNSEDCAIATDKTFCVVLINVK